MERMTESEWRGFLSAGTRTGKLATVRADGRPHVTPIWFVLDESGPRPEIVFNTGETSVKGRNLRRDPRLTLCVDDDRPPFSFVVLEGEARFDDDPARLREWAARIGGRYMGEDRADEFGARNGVPGELLVRVRIDRVTAEKDIAA